RPMSSTGCLASLGGHSSSLHTPRTIYSHTGLRGLAASYVVLFHFFGDLEVSPDSLVSVFVFNAGYAVDLFFILSGFILNWVYLPSDDRRVPWRSYLQGRAARILPLYYLTMLVCLMLSLYSIARHGHALVGEHFPLKVLLNLFLLSGIVWGWRGTLNVPAWS